MPNQNSYLLFRIERRRYALAVSEIIRVLPAVETTPVQNMPPIVRGLINVGGEVLPVVDIRVRPDQPVEDIDPDDRFILTKTDETTMALLVNSVDDVQELAEISISLPITDGWALTEFAENSPERHAATLVATDHGEIVLIQNMRFFVRAVSSIPRTAFLSEDSLNAIADPGPTIRNQHQISHPEATDDLPLCLCDLPRSFEKIGNVDRGKNGSAIRGTQAGGIARRGSRTLRGPCRRESECLHPILAGHLPERKTDSASG